VQVSRSDQSPEVVGQGLQGQGVVVVLNRVDHPLPDPTLMLVHVFDDAG
jgi:hypothetical protein